MGVDSKVFVVAEKAQALDVGNAVKNALDNLIREQATSYAREHNAGTLLNLLRSDDNYDKEGNMRFTLESRIEANSFDCFQFNFCLNSEARTVWYFTDCSCDTNDITGFHTLMFHVGCWGQYAVIMQRIVEALLPYGDVYWDHNDSDDEDYILQN